MNSSIQESHPSNPSNPSLYIHHSTVKCWGWVNHAVPYRLPGKSVFSLELVQCFINSTNCIFILEGSHFSFCHTYNNGFHSARFVCVWIYLPAHPFDLPFSCGVERWARLVRELRDKKKMPMYERLLCSRYLFLQHYLPLTAHLRELESLCVCVRSTPWHEAASWQYWRH